MTSKLNILVVEDQSGPLKVISLAIREAIFKEMPEDRYSDDPQKDLEERSVDVARCYNEAEEFIKSKIYGLVFLDHSLPYENQSHLERTDSGAFSRSIRDVGYGLIPVIRQTSPRSLIIGTSSGGEYELRHFKGKDYQPDCKVDKISRELSSDLTKIINLATGGRE